MCRGIVLCRLMTAFQNELSCGSNTGRSYAHKRSAQPRGDSCGTEGVTSTGGHLRSPLKQQREVRARADCPSPLHTQPRAVPGGHSRRAHRETSPGAASVAPAPPVTGTCCRHQCCSHLGKPKATPIVRAATTFTCLCYFWMLFRLKQQFCSNISSAINSLFLCGIRS